MHGNESLSEIQDKLGNIYKEVNQRLSIHQILNRIDEHSGYLHKCITVLKHPAERHLINCLSWLIAFCNKASLDLQDSILKNYPAYCRYCLENPCICELTQKIPRITTHVREKEVRGKYDTIRNQIILGKLIPTLDYFTEMLTRMYTVNKTRWRLIPYEILGKLHEERAELQETFRRFE